MSSARYRTDAELLAAVPHDEAAYEAFYRSYVRRVTGFAAKRCSGAEDVADVVAVTFVRLLDAARRYDPVRGEPAAFVMGIAANVIRDHRRRETRHQALVTKLAASRRLDVDDIDRIEAAIDAAQLTGDLHDALAAVPPGEQEMFRLVVAGHSPAQAADLLGITHGAARTRLARARQRLRQHVHATRAPAEETLR